MFWFYYVTTFSVGSHEPSLNLCECALSDCDDRLCKASPLTHIQHYRSSLKRAHKDSGLATFWPLVQSQHALFYICDVLSVHVCWLHVWWSSLAGGYTSLFSKTCFMDVNFATKRVLSANVMTWIRRKWLESSPTVILITVVGKAHSTSAVL